MPDYNEVLPWDQWNQPEGDYPDRWKPENIGDRLVGRLIRARVATMPDGKRLPSLTLLTANGEMELLAAQLDLQRKLSEARPRVGQTIDVFYEDLERLQGGKTLKRFRVSVDGVDSSQLASARPAPAATPAAPQAAANAGAAIAQQVAQATGQVPQSAPSPATPTGLTNEAILALIQNAPAAVTPAMYAQLAAGVAPAAAPATFNPSDLV